MKRWAVPLVPFTLSLGLSLSTVGSHPFWQDSGLYLTAVKELGVLYAPGFVVYEILCRLWTLLLFFVDFTLAVHLFSSVCAAGAAAAIALAVRDCLRSRGPVFKVLEEDPGPLADEVGIAAGVLLAGSFTFWSTAIYAKGYAFYYLILALLIWRMIRADDSGRPRDFTIVAALIGLAWQAHPSSLLTGVALVLFVAAHAGHLGRKGVFKRILVAAGFALAPSFLILPFLIARDPWLMLSRPTRAGEFLRFIVGGHFTGVHGVFGYDSSRGATSLRYTWEDLLGVGLAFLGAGVAVLLRRNRRFLAGLLAWVIPYAVITVLFKIEGQHDCWLVAARMPLFLAIGLGACELGRRAGSRGAWLLRATALLATVWAVTANYADVVQRNYVLAEAYGRCLLENADPGAVVILSGDDSNGLASYLQRVRGIRTDVTLITSSFLDARSASGISWYDDALLRRNPQLKRPDYAGLRARFPDIEKKQLATAAFINANVDRSAPILSEVAVPPALLRPDLQLVSAGVFVKVLAPGVEPRVEDRYWRFPFEPEEIRTQYRRSRGQELRYEAEGVRVRPVPYERRLASLILRSRFRLALARFEAKALGESSRLCQSIIDYDDEEFEQSPEVIHLLGISYYGLGQLERAEPALRRSSQVGIRPENRATAFCYLGNIARKRGDDATAKRMYDAALAVPGVDPNILRAIEGQKLDR